MKERLENVKAVEINAGRWSAVVKVELEDGETLEYVASADSGITYGDSLFFGTREDYAEMEALAF